MFRKLVTNGETITLSNTVIDELHRQENIEKVKCIMGIIKILDSNNVVNKMTDNDFEGLFNVIREILYADACKEQTIEEAFTNIQNLVYKIKTKDKMNKIFASMMSKTIDLDDIIFTKNCASKYRVFYSPKGDKIFCQQLDNGCVDYIYWNRNWSIPSCSCKLFYENNEMTMKELFGLEECFLDEFNYTELIGTESELKYIYELISKYVEEASDFLINDSIQDSWDNIFQQLRFFGNRSE